MLLLHAAAAGGGEHFAGAEVAAGVEGGAEAVHDFEGGGGEHLPHEFELLHADAVLAGDAAAAGEALGKVSWLASSTRRVCSA